MSNSKRSSAKFWLLAGVVVILASAGAACMWPMARAAAANESKQLSAQAPKTSRGEAQNDFQLAIWLDPGNQSARLGLGMAQLAAGDATAALANLNQAGEGTKAEDARIRAQVETGQYTSAAASATILAANPAATDNDLVLASYADELSGNAADIPPLKARLRSSAALQAVTRAQAGKLPLAAALYGSGLLMTSRHVLGGMPESFERDLLLGRIDYALGTPQDLSKATTLLLAAATSNPADAGPRQLLVTIYRDQNHFTKATAQQALINKLAAGQP